MTNRMRLQRALANSPKLRNAIGLRTLEATLSCLWILTPLAATISLLVVIIAMFTNQWLHTEEKMNNPFYNGTGEKDYLSKLTISGLWMFCFTNPGETLYDCNKIDYFSKEEYSPDPNDSTLAIPYTVTRSVIFFLTASLLLCGGYCCCILGQCVKHRTLYTFASGIIFILTGLVMLFGLIMYISVFKSEVGSKLRPKSQLQPPAFYYWYGYSFLLYIGGLIATQLTGLSAIFLFIYEIQYECKRKHLSELNGMKKKKKSSLMVPPPPLPAAMDGRYCRRHPHAYVDTTSAIYIPYPSPQQKRYFFSKEPFVDDTLSMASPCSVHRMDVDRGRTPPPPPPTISYHFDDCAGVYDLDETYVLGGQMMMTSTGFCDGDVLRRTTPV